MKTLWISLLMMFCVATAMAQQEEGPPQEPPYVEDSNEFSDEGFSIEEEFQDAAEVDNEELPYEIEESSGPIFSEEPALVEEIEPFVAPEPSFMPSPSPKTVQKQNQKGGVEYIEHPLAAKGLMRIEKDGTYVYRLKEDQEGRENHSASLRFGSIDPPKIIALDGTTFQQMYTDSMVPVLLFDYEWQPFEGFGKLGMTAGFGLITVNGKGRFADGTPAQEEYTFIALPLNFGVVYRMEFAHTQWVAPYVAAGGSYLGVAEIRDDGKSPSMVGVPGAYGSGGLLFNITAIGQDTAFTLRNEYGIQNLWLTAEYRHLQTFNDELDFSSGIINVGVSVDY